MQTRGRTAFILGTFLLLMSAAPLAAAQGEDPLSGPAEVTIQVHLGEAGGGMVIWPPEITVAPNTNITFHVVNVGGVAHDFTILNSDPLEFAEEDLRATGGSEDGSEALKTPLLQPGEEYNLTVLAPDGFEGSLTYICSVEGHRDQGMEGTLNVGGAAEEKDIIEYGVDYLAYWVGIVSFVLLFIVLFGTFFLFRYGESKNVVDHRTGGPKTITVAAGDTEGETREMVEPMLPSPGTVVKVLIAVVLLGAAFYFLM